MAEQPTIRLRVPAKAQKGEIIEIKAQITHDMETGQRKDADGKTIPRRIIEKFTCTWNDEVIFDSVWHQAVSANPLISFHARAEKSGTIVLTWVEDSGAKFSEKAAITVEG